MTKRERISPSCVLHATDMERQELKITYLPPGISVVQVEMEECYVAVSLPAKINTIDTNYENYEDKNLGGDEIQLF